MRHESGENVPEGRNEEEPTQREIKNAEETQSCRRDKHRIWLPKRLEGSRQYHHFTQFCTVVNSPYRLCISILFVWDFLPLVKEIIIRRTKEYKENETV